jgi:dual specificity tyrosine-phosphorylation-regulated kinase 2/3/4
MNSKITSNSSRIRIENILQSSMKKSLRSISLLSNTGHIKSRNELSLCNSLDFDNTRKSYKRTPPTRSSVNSSTEVPKPCIVMSPSKVLLEYHEKLSEYEYKEIANYPEIYYLGTTKKKLHGKFCDDRMYYRSFVGDHIAYRYEIMKLLGDGSFGIVIQCFDHKTQQLVAVKILRKGKKFSKIGETEDRVINLVTMHGEDDTIVTKLDSFKFRGHFCIVYELLSLDLYQFLRKNDFKGTSMSILKRIAIQIIIALKHIHSIGFIHCDLKPENILFKAENKSSIKLIDFGSACEKNNKIFTYIQSRFYRAPEVIIDAGYDEKIDIWGLGCILFELYKGVPIFQGVNEHDQLCKIVEILGEVPRDMVEACKRKNVFFEENGLLRDKISGNLIKPGSKSVAGLIKNAEKSFIDFLLDCLKIHPSQRIDAETALAHPWFKTNRLQINRNSRLN